MKKVSFIISNLIKFYFDFIRSLLKVLHWLFSTLKKRLISNAKIKLKAFQHRERINKKLINCNIKNSYLIKPVYGFYSNDRVPFRALTSAGGGTGAGRSIYYYQEDQTIDLNELINTNNVSIKLPNDFVLNGFKTLL